MSKTVTVNGTNFTLNQQGDNPPWGENLSDLIEALVEVANSVAGPNDILTTSFDLANNISSATNVTGLQFSTAAVRSAIINYSLYRSSSTNELSECGVMLITYKSTANTWELAQYSVGDAGVTFTITSTGQIRYQSTDIGSTSYSGKLKFNAKAFAQT